MNMSNVKYVYIIIADGEVDQVCDDTITAFEQVKDLRAMGCIVRTMYVLAQDQDAEIAKINS